MTGPSDAPNATDRFMTWVLESWLDLQPPEIQRAFAWGLDSRKLIAEARVASGVHDQADLGAIALAQTFLDEFRSTQAS